MPRPATKAELMVQMAAEYERLLDDFSALDADGRIAAGACEAWSAKDLLAHLDAWHRMFLGWEREGRDGRVPEMPAPGYSWSATPALNEEIYLEHRDDPLDEVLSRLEDSYNEVRAVVESYGGDLFVKKRHGWTGSTSVGSYAVSATSSHYAWASKLMRRFAKDRVTISSGG